MRVVLLFEAKGGTLFWLRRIEKTPANHSFTRFDAYRHVWRARLCHNADIDLGAEAVRWINPVSAPGLP